ncbi:hypothetical protein IV102_22420 [bacterium]|nr:hypothetical protein [bacterium]
MRACGFSLAELLLAAFLILLGVMATVGLSFSVLSSQSKASEREIGQALARQLLEEHVYYAQTNPECAWWSRANIWTLYSHIDTQVGEANYRGVVYVTDLPLAADPEAANSRSLPLKRLEVMVYRPDANPRSGPFEARLSRIIYAP